MSVPEAPGSFAESLHFIVVVNKNDTVEESAAKENFADTEAIVFISVNKRWHTEVLKERMMDALLQGPLQTENTLITNARHYHALKEMKGSLRDIKPGQDTKLPGDVLSLDIRSCLHYLAEITGEFTNEVQLDYFFSKFCIGK